MKYLILVFFTMLIISCVTPYEMHDFEEITKNHQEIAIIPFDMVFTGIIPDGMSKEELNEILGSESKAFQVSLFNEIYKSTNRGKGGLRIKIQDYRKTWKILDGNDLSYDDLITYNPENLAEVLGVDAILVSRIQKHRLMSDLESFGIDLGIHLIASLHKHHSGIWWLHGFTKAKEYNASYQLYDGYTGDLIWSISYEDEANWSRNERDIIDEINRKAARHFPYRW